jgi:hypothetical protein
MTSNRQKKKAASEGAARLRNKPGWDPHAPKRSSVEEQLQNLGQEERTQKTYTEGEICSDCLAARAKSSDDTTLCPTHFSELMGF